jgi:hypothetical protein
MPHSVYPFYTSDDYRITVSGNVNFSWDLYMVKYLHGNT